MEVCVKISFIACSLCVWFLQPSNSAIVRENIKQVGTVVKDIVAEELKENSTQKAVHSTRVVCSNCPEEQAAEASGPLKRSYATDSGISKESSITQKKVVKPKSNVNKKSDTILTKHNSGCVDCVQKGALEHSKFAGQARGDNYTQSTTYRTTGLSSRPDNSSSLLNTSRNIPKRKAPEVSSKSTNIQLDVNHVSDKSTFRATKNGRDIDFKINKINQTSKEDNGDSKIYSVLSTLDDKGESYNKSDIQKQGEKNIPINENSILDIFTKNINDLELIGQTEKDRNSIIEQKNGESKIPRTSVNLITENLSRSPEDYDSSAAKTEINYSKKQGAVTDKLSRKTDNSKNLHTMNEMSEDDRMKKNMPRSSTLQNVVPEDFSVKQSHSEYQNKVLPKNSTAPREKCNAACALMEGRKRFRLEQIKRHILSELRLTTVPNVTGTKLPMVSPIMEQLTKEIQSDSANDYTDYDDDDDETIKVKRIMTFGKPLLSEEHKNMSGGCYFTMTDDIKSKRVRHAVLWMYLDPYVDRSREDVLVNVYVIREKSKHGKGNLEWVHYLKLPSKKAVGWIDFDLSKIVHRWIRHPSTNRGLKLEAIDGKGRNIVTTPYIEDFDDSGGDHMPFLDLMMVKHRHHRKRRHTDMCPDVDSYGEHECCRQPMVVNFVELGWTFVRAPPSYNAYYCAGDCDIDSPSDGNPFTSVIQRTERGYSGCCTPKKMGSMNMLYQDQDGGFNFVVLPNMSVQRCGCI